MNRREFIRFGADTFVILTVLPNYAFGDGNGRKPPNLLIIHTDEHNFRTLGCYRSTLSPEQAFMWGAGNVVETPNIDQLAKQGVLCTNFYATTPVCSPSRASFMSGLYPQRTPVMDNNEPMSNGIVTFAAILQKQGYVTGYAGKWHLDGDGRPQWAPGRKFGFEDNRFMFNRGHWKQFEDTPEGPRVKSQKNGRPDYGVEGADEKSFATDWLADKTVDFIRANKDKPFCYMLSIPDPHDPDSVRAPYDSMYRKMDFKKPRTAGRPQDGVPSWASASNDEGDESKYFGMVKCIDDNVGKIMKALKDNNLTDNTIVVFTSDHGDLRGEHGRQNKGVPLEASAKVPFVISYPGKIKGGRIVEESLGCVDFMPTILSLMGCKSDAKVDGRDASAFFTGTVPAGWKDITFIRGTGTRNWVAAVDRRYKLVISPKHDDPPWLIDKIKDPDELTNFCFNPEFRGIVRELAKELAAYGKTYDDPSLKNDKLQHDLEWAMGEKAAYYSFSFK